MGGRGDAAAFVFELPLRSFVEPLSEDMAARIG